MKDYSETLIQQIDTMNAVASAFSNFASMPAQQNETLNVVEVVELAIDIFNEEKVVFESESPEIISKIDRTQLIRIITNLVKMPFNRFRTTRNKTVFVTVKDSNNVLIIVEDNGIGIKTEDISRIFEPKFTTKKQRHGIRFRYYQKTSLKIIKEQLPLKQNMEKELYCVTSIINS
jgi:nitrogen fixation/metabolism regulation signal transduction histidine kinase